MKYHEETITTTLEWLQIIPDADNMPALKYMGEYKKWEALMPRGIDMARAILYLAITIKELEEK